MATRYSRIYSRNRIKPFSCKKAIKPPTDCAVIIGPLEHQKYTNQPKRAKQKAETTSTCKLNDMRKGNANGFFGRGGGSYQVVKGKLGAHETPSPLKINKRNCEEDVSARYRFTELRFSASRSSGRLAKAVAAWE